MIAGESPVVMAGQPSWINQINKIQAFIEFQQNDEGNDGGNGFHTVDKNLTRPSACRSCGDDFDSVY